MSSLLIRAAVEHLNKNKKTSDDFITEALSDSQKKKIATMPSTDHSVKKIHDRIFGEENDTIEIPYSREDDKKITSTNYSQEIKSGGFNRNDQHHKHVFNHLHLHGYGVTDYVGGYARKNPTSENPDGGREEKIGKILQATNANDKPTPLMSKPTYKRQQKEDGTIEFVKDNYGNKIVDKGPQRLSVAQAFANDPIRAAKKDVKLVVTRSKEGVGGMSTGKGWTSCMDIDNGCNRHYVPKDLEHGTLTAYLVRKGDEKAIDNPVGRINLKQFKDSDSGHKIFRPESNVYGAMPASAHKAVSQWAETMYPHKEDSVYLKHTELYNDDGDNLKITGNPEFSKIATHVDHHLSDIMRSHELRQEEYQNKYGEQNWDDNVQDHVEGYLNNLPEAHKNNLVIHTRLNSENDPDDTNEWEYGSEHHTTRWAHERSVQWSSIHEKDLMHHLNTAEHNSTFGGNYDSKMLEDATYVHHKLLKEALKRGSQEVKDKAISHMLDNAHKDWYQHMDSEWGDETPHLFHHTDSPALIKKIYETSTDETIPNTVPSIEDMSGHDKGVLLHKVGKHGDDDLLHEHVNSEHYGGHVLSFHEGINSRPDSEERQHKLISELNLGAGYAKHGEVKQVKDKYDLMQAHHPHWREEGHYSEGKNDLYADIARYTTHKSVHQALSSRHDTQTPEIQDALKQNKNFN